MQAALADFHVRRDEVVALAKAVQQIPAPTFAEGQRAAFIAQQMTDLGLDGVVVDEGHNVYGRYPGRDSKLPPIVVSAHSDTVFAADTDLTLHERDGLIYGPGIGDNATGVAGVLAMAQAVQAHDLKPIADIWFVANSCEEGLGNLQGMRAVVERFGPKAVYLVVEGGLYGQISHQAIGVRRFKIRVTAPGGHSWGSFGTASAIHVLGQIIARLDRMTVPNKPKTTFNVGEISGGTSINTIAQSAELLLDLRSEAPDMLDALVQSVSGIVERIGQSQQRRHVGIEMEEIGNRPAGYISRTRDVVQWAEEALRYVGCKRPNFIASSTDANVPLSDGLTAVCVGLTESGNAHRLDEFMDPEKLPSGLGQLLLLLLAASGVAKDGD